MKKYLQIAALVLIGINFLFAVPRVKIVTEAVTPHQVTAFTTNSVSPGLNVVGNGTYVYLSAMNFGDATAITLAEWTFLSKPTGSTAAFQNISTTWTSFKVDLKGQYQVKVNVTTSSGTKDTTITITSANFTGVGNFEGISATWPQCMSCHATMPRFAPIFDKWKVSKHANIFKKEITTGAAYYSTSCMKCHTTGYDHNVVSNNNGFDDVATALGWTWVGPPNPGKWDSLKTNKPGLVQHATIGCEMCHGAGSEHSQSAEVSKIEITYDAGVCGQCHDEPWRHNKYAQFENSMHSEAVWSNSFAQGTTSQNNSLGNCIRCHDAKGFVNFINGEITNTTGMTIASHSAVTCQACHDPHGNANEFSLRDTPASGDTLGNGYHYTEGGKGQLCMSCHKARRDVVTYVNTNISSTWGPHHSVQADVFLGKNAAQFDSIPYISGSHKYAVTDGCVDCHMVATTDTGTVTRDKVGGHSWKLHNEEANYDHATGCVSCHGPIGSFDEFIATTDYDGDQTIEPVQEEIKGMIQVLRIILPPYGQDTVIVAQCTTLVHKKALWNYMLISYDGSYGMHNTKFAVNVLNKTIFALGGPYVPVELTAFDATVVDKKAILKWETASETNNRGFDIERKTGKEFVKIGYITGKGNSTQLVNYTFTDKLENLADGKVYYRLKQIDFDGTSVYTKEVNVDYNGGPKSYSLSQNYPNPFNPQTTIKFALPYDSNVKLIVYSITGEVVKNLINEVRSAGNHEISFNLKDANSTIASGVYFYSIEASAVDGSNTFRNVKKMVLMK